MLPSILIRSIEEGNRSLTLKDFCSGKRGVIDIWYSMSMHKNKNISIVGFTGIPNVCVVQQL